MSNPPSRRPIASFFRHTAQGAVTLCRRLAITPNAVSAASMVAAAGAGSALLGVAAYPELLMVVVPLVVLRLWLNMLDGMLAVASHQVSPIGELWNELPDRLSDLLILLGAAHSGLCSPLTGYWAAVAALLVAYVGTFGQAVGVGRRFEGWMSKPWRMAAVLVGVSTSVLLPSIQLPSRVATSLLAIIPSHFTPLDLAHGLIVLGSLDTIRRRLRHIVRALPAA